MYRTITTRPDITSTRATNGAVVAVEYHHATAATTCRQDSDVVECVLPVNQMMLYIQQGSRTLAATRVAWSEGRLIHWHSSAFFGWAVNFTSTLVHYHSTNAVKSLQTFRNDTILVLAVQYTLQAQ